MEKKHYLGYWDCDYCCTKRISGLVRKCPGCGHPVGEGVKYYVDDNLEEIADSAIIPKGPDWQCCYCGTYNRDSVTECENCSAGRDDTKSYFEVQEEMKEKEARKEAKGQEQINRNLGKEYDQEHEEEKIQDESYKTNYDEEEEPKYERKSSKIKNFFSNNFKYIFGSIALIAVACSLIFIFMPREKTITVQDFSWKRTISIDKYQTFQDSDWSMPAGARLRYTNQEEKYKRQVQTGTKTVTYQDYVKTGEKPVKGPMKDNGNGTFSQSTTMEDVYGYVTKSTQEPVYTNIPVMETKYYYDIDRYAYDHQLVTSGKDKSPYWDKEPVEKANPRVGDLRVSGKNEEYKITGTIEDEEPKDYTLDYETWQSLEKGQKVKCKVYFDGSIKVIETVK